MNYPEIKELIEKERALLGSATKVAIKCDVSGATISNILNDKFDDVREGMWRKIAAALGWRPRRWQVIETENIRTMHTFLQDAKDGNMWLMVAEKAGGSKSAGATTFAATNKNVFYLECESWPRSFFLKKFAQSIGIPSNTSNNDFELMDEIIRFFQQRSGDKPLVILDQVDKLYEASMACLIPIFNGLEDRVGVVIMGTEHLKKRIQNGVKFNKQHYDEIESRFGRSYLHTPGATRKEVAAIAVANGLEDTTAIKRIWEEIWNNEKGRHTVGGMDVNVIKDMRRLKRCIQREILALAELHAKLDEAEAPAEAEAVAA